MVKFILALSSGLVCAAGHYGCTAQTTYTEDPLSERVTLVAEGKTIAERFIPPQGFYRAEVDSMGFAFYLRHLPLHPIDYPVHYFDGRLKRNPVFCSVIEQDIDPVDLQQCADAVMRLRGEYLYAQGRYSEIAFRFVSDGKFRYFSAYSKQKHTYEWFRKYMKYVFSYANTASLKAQLKPVVQYDDIQIGDVFIQSGNPYGHAVIVVDVVENEEGEKKILLAQSYMPAQETHILINTESADSPWFDVREGELITPEWTFHSSDLRRF